MKYGNTSSKSRKVQYIITLLIKRNDSLRRKRRLGQAYTEYLYTKFFAKIVNIRHSERKFVLESIILSLKIQISHSFTPSCSRYRVSLS